MKKGATRLDELTGNVVNIPGADPDYLARYSTWKLPAQEIYLKKRHEITGVAANPAEKGEIAEAIPDPSKNTPTEFRSKLKQLRKMLLQAKNRKLMFRSIGIENPTDKQLSTVPLKSVPVKEHDVYINRPFSTDNLPTAVNPKTGERLIMINGEWVPEKEK